MTPRGLRNNNPLNIRKDGTKWYGMAYQQTDPSFVQFKNMACGFRAAFKILITYYDKYKLDTIRGIITRWAPPCENDTENYIRVVSERSGIDADAVIDVCDDSVIKPIVAAMAFMENGIEANYDDIHNGYLMAFCS